MRGVTVIDTLYEFAGYTHGALLLEHLVLSGTFVGLIVAGGILRLYFLGVQRQQFFPLLAYPAYLAILAFAIWPMDVTLTHEPPDAGPGESLRATVRVPRIAALVHGTVDPLVGYLVEEIEPEFERTAFAWMRAASVNASARLESPDLEERVQSFIHHCFWPAAVTLDLQAGWKTLPLLDDEGFYQDPRTEFLSAPVSGSEDPVPGCAALRETLRTEIDEELGGSPVHRQGLETYLAAGGAEGTVRKFYLRRVVYNETFKGPNEVATLRKAVPGYSVFNEEMYGVDLRTARGFRRKVRSAYSFFVGMIAAGLESWDLEGLGPSTYYAFSELAPYIYGFLSGLLVMGFPIAALLSFWPGGWAALVNYWKIFLSVKAWPVFWAWLSGMNVERARFDPEDPTGFEGTFGSGEMFTALAGMYLIAPLLSFTLVSLAAKAGTVGLGALVGKGQTGGSVPSGVAAGGASKAAGAVGAL